MSVAKSHLVATAAVAAAAVTIGQRLQDGRFREMPKKDSTPCYPAHSCIPYEIIIIITCVSAGFHRPTKNRERKKTRDPFLCHCLLLIPAAVAAVAVAVAAVCVHFAFRIARPIKCVYVCCGVCVGVRVYNYPPLIIFK